MTIGLDPFRALRRRGSSGSGAGHPTAEQERLGGAEREPALMGAITGVWAAVIPLLWALGWTVTAAAGIDVDRQYAVFGAFGAITFMALSGVVLDRLRAATPAAPSPQHGPPTATASQTDPSI